MGNEQYTGKMWKEAVVAY